MWVKCGAGVDDFLMVRCCQCMVGVEGLTMLSPESIGTVSITSHL